MHADLGSLEVEQGFAIGGEVMPGPFAVFAEPPRRSTILEPEVEQIFELGHVGGSRDLYQNLDPAVEVAVHQVRRADPRLRLAAVLEPEDPAVLEEAAEDAADLDVVPQTRNVRLQSADAAAPDLDRYAGLGRAIQRVDDAPRRRGS